MFLLVNIDLKFRLFYFLSLLQNNFIEGDNYHLNTVELECTFFDILRSTSYKQ